MTPRDDKNPEIELVECPMCHWRVPVKDTRRLGVRRLCLACIEAWFGDGDGDGDGEEDEDSA